MPASAAVFAGYLLSSKTQLITQNSGLQILCSKEFAKNQCVINSVQLLMVLAKAHYQQTKGSV